MKNFHYLNDTIAAVSTPAGVGGIGIVRMSGSDALSIADKVFSPRKGGGRPSGFLSHSVHYGFIVDKIDGPEEVIDEVLLTVMRAPGTYTREDIVEINCHGGYVSLQAVLQCVLDAGARLADQGEFTKRAFLNGRIDLAQAEAVLDIIEAKTRGFLKVSTNQLKGELTRELESIREALMSLYTQIEGELNFPESHEGVNEKKHVLFIVEECSSRISKLLETSRHGKILKEGIRIVLCGKPNVGKSSLLNALLKIPRAIVSDIAGTTRDTIEETTQIGGIPLQLVDTAGILEPRDLIEKEAIRRSRLYIESADLVLVILDLGSGISKEDEGLVHKLEGANTLVVLNKCDLASMIKEEDIARLFPGKKYVRVSALNGMGIDVLEEKVVKHVLHGNELNTDGILVSNLRHIHALKEGFSALTKAVELINRQMSLEFVSEEIKTAVASLDAITGKDLDEDLLDQIFARFCVGK